MSEAAVEIAEPRFRAAIEISSVTVGMVVFALCSHRGGWWALASAAGLLASGATIGRSLGRAAAPRAMLGLARWSRALTLYVVAALAIGVTLGVADRYSLGLPLWPAGGLERFVIVACLIGATEELVYRGWLLGRAGVFGTAGAILAAAGTHALYKTALFAWPVGAPAVNLTSLALLTFAGGIVFGALRVSSASVVPSMIAHAAFDFMVYGAVAQAPWWVWT